MKKTIKSRRSCSQKRSGKVLYKVVHAAHHQGEQSLVLRLRQSDAKQFQDCSSVQRNQLLDDLVAAETSCQDK
eukprot:11735168-Ditylum_brightwellii.AAC.1